MAKVLIGADVAPSAKNTDLFSTGNITELIGGDLEAIWLGADIRIFNLETPITDRGTPIKKCGPNLCAPTSAIEGIAALSPTLISLANNHILDQGDAGLYDTAELLKSRNICYVGAGENIESAKQPYIIDTGNEKIGIYACCEHEFSGADKDCAGANLYDPLYSFDDVSELKKRSDTVIVLYHGGKEHYRYPSPQLQRVCRRFAEKGADYVLCQHSHCAGCMETYLGAHIVYGQGNFCFNYYKSELMSTGLLAELDTEKKNIDFIPLENDGNRVWLSYNKSIKEEFYKRSEQIKDPDFVSSNYKAFADKSLDGIILSTAKTTFLQKVFYKLFNGAVMSDNKLTRLINRIECEAWRELFITGLKNKLYTKKN